jgi:hypothetical protein
MKTAWESELAKFLTDLSAVQAESLEILSRKRELLVAADAEGLTEIAGRERALIDRLQGCLEHRRQLLDWAADDGLPSDSVRSLSAALPRQEARPLAGRIDAAARRARLLQHHSLTNWVLVQRTLIHLSQMLEIIATGGKRKPTYEKGKSVEATGALVDRVA